MQCIVVLDNSIFLSLFQFTEVGKNHVCGGHDDCTKFFRILFSTHLLLKSEMKGASNHLLTEGSTQLDISTNSGIPSVGSDLKNQTPFQSPEMLTVKTGSVCSSGHFIYIFQSEVSIFMYV